MKRSSKLYEALKSKFASINCAHSETSTTQCTRDNFPHCDLGDAALNRCAVLILLFHSQQRLHVLFTIRSYALKSFPGEICFPGGKFDPALDESYEDTACREAQEEIGLKRANLRIVCKLCPVISPVGHYFVPFVGLVCNPNTQGDPCEETLGIVEELKPNQDEVDKIFWVSLSYFHENLGSTDVFSSFVMPHTKLDASLFSSVPIFKSLPQDQEFYSQRHFILFRDEVFNEMRFKADEKPGAAFIYGINATLTLVVTLLIEQEAKFKISESTFLTHSNLVEYLKDFRLISYLLFRNYLLDKEKRAARKGAKL